MRFPSMRAADAVQPMPGLPRPSSAPLMTARLAASMAAPRRVSSAVAGAFSPMVSTAIELATSPAAWPPMPSHTAKQGVRMRNESSLWLRTRPTSERAPQAMKAFLPQVASAPARPSTGIVARPGALTGSCGWVSSGPADSLRWSFVTDGAGAGGTDGTGSSMAACLGDSAGAFSGWLVAACLGFSPDMCLGASVAAYLPACSARAASGTASSSGASSGFICWSSAAITDGSLA